MRWVAALLLGCLSLLAAAQTNPFPQVASAYLVAVDGVTLWEKDAVRRLPPASLTKLMTALVVLEQANLRDRVTVSRAAAAQTGSRIGLRSGEVFLAEDLLTATLVASANDACVALADHVAGDERRFAARMNERARALGMRETHFVNACGLDASGHVSSARDLALLATAVLQRPETTRITRLPSARIVSVDGQREHAFASTNALIGRYPGALGLKTGHTRRAGNCLVAYAERGNKRVLMVLLNGQDRWWDAVDILDLAFAHAGPPS